LSDSCFCQLGHCLAEAVSCWLNLFRLWHWWDLLSNGEIALESAYLKDLNDFYIVFFPGLLGFAKKLR